MTRVAINDTNNFKKMMKAQKINSLILKKKLIRSSAAHKGEFGHVLVIGGNIGFGGAGLLASKAAVNCGAGLVSLATRSSHVSASLNFCPEVMVKPVDSGQALEKYLDYPSVICLGPGLGQDYWSEQMIYKSLERAKKNNTPMLIDADGLNLLPKFIKKLPLPKKIVLTPHIGEASILLNTSKEIIKKNRILSAKKISKKYSAVVVLKGKNSIICWKDKYFICEKGNAGMATGGMGDVLSGIISSFIAQKMTLLNAACLGVELHAEAADEYSNVIGMNSLTPTDLLDIVKELI